VLLLKKEGCDEGFSRFIAEFHLDDFGFLAYESIGKGDADKRSNTGMKESPMGLYEEALPFSFQTVEKAPGVDGIVGFAVPIGL
jgi:hypothetical protein